jgi:peroxiredoxin Q/BCP
MSKATSSTEESAIGLEVPAFAATATGGAFNLVEHRGSPLVLYFYPKDNTPGCTTEAMQFRDLHPEFLASGARIFGISRDSLKSHEGFKAKLGLPFELITDSDEAVCRLFNVIKTKNLYGKQVLGIERSTFLIDAKGRLANEWRGVKADGHAQAVLQTIKSL